MSLDEKLAQLVGYWVDQGDEIVAPMAGEMASSQSYSEATRHGLGHLTRVYGTRPVDPVERARWLWAEQTRLRTQTRLGIAALVHEECLTGLAAWKAATFPTPLAWGAAFDPETVREMGRLIGASMRQLGIHQGLAPVLDVIRDPRWGRVDECISEDPYVVGTIGTAYVEGMQSAGVHATLKHFVGYSASQSGRNHAPVHLGRRELSDVFLPPFEMAVRDGGVRSVMNSYAEIDGIPVGSAPELLTGLLRDDWGFDGVVVSDYFSVAFLETMHAVAADAGEAAQLALAAGIDVELPTGDAYLAPLAERVRSGATPIELVDRAVVRVLMQKEQLGLLDDDASEPPTAIDLDTPAHRDLARRLAERSAVLLSNDGILPLADPAPSRVAVIGANSASSSSLMGCYSFINHVLAHHPETPDGIEVPSILEAVRRRWPTAIVHHAIGAEVEGDDRSGISAAVDAARAADVAIVAVGDQAGLFGRGTVGEGNDVESLELPGVQRELVEAVVATGTPVILVILSGRPYAVGWALDGPTAPAAVLQSFFPGEEGATAIARLMAGDIAPSGRLPISLPRSAGAQPFSYLQPILGGVSEITSADSTPVRPFGFGLGYTDIAYDALAVPPAPIPAGEPFDAVVRLRNIGHRATDEIVQLYARDTVASATRPVAQLVAYARVPLDAGEAAEVRFTVVPSRLAFTDRSMRRVVEAGEIELWVGDSATRRVSSSVWLSGATYAVTASDARRVEIAVDRGADVPNGRHDAGGDGAGMPAVG
ncbi:glycoside hydrolase family 3 N-terminal domain-containing protein [Schumannella sp. 10F1B-5-1]|uniref:beta-xylosidase/alpha-l-arabinosidase n=1 Tax=Schumannella sp. 10F1B-5-1 TaxID=2590780 RepID=UPI0011304793|nr:glycoside hydrolase family 3 N-terminal domain-containing protein [Schumannella sp. 10F1B-5-1]TPW73214.1 glycosyl hydrolase [Schumannella sp. 10F1B-5-1]